LNLLIERLLSGRADLDLFEGQDQVALDQISTVEEFDVIGAPVDTERLPPSWRSAYVPTVSAAAWDRALDGARPWDGESPEDWVTFVPTRNGLGLAMPEDSSEEPHVSAFIRGASGLVRVLRLGRGPVAEVRSGHDPRCGFPDREVCPPGLCGCVLRIREVDPRGLICVCPL
jgi:hypothetical protein